MLVKDRSVMDQGAKCHDLYPLSTLLRLFRTYQVHSGILPIGRKGRVQKDVRYRCH